LASSIRLANERSIAERLSDPILELRDENDRLVRFNDDWQANNADTASETVLIRAIDPDLANEGIADALADPMLDIRNSDGTRVALNTHWRDANSVEIAATGLAPASDSAAALLLTLSPGSYTALVRGASGGSGIALVEVYDVG
jgi:hypothetical protein